jgi:UDP-N-acetylmuramoyl-tripeptide--D-alanyl-D-alanine ligase
MMAPRFDSLELARWCGGEWLSAPPPVVTGIFHDARRIEPGALFVAVRGARFDGHQFVADAAARGAVAAVVSRADEGARAAGLPLLSVPDTTVALQAMARGYRRRLGLSVVGVTGSTGKTTIKDMIAALLETTLPTGRTQGNWNNEIGLPLSLLALPAGTRVGVLELGISHPGEMAPLCGIAEPDWGVIGNVGPVHLEFFESVDAIAREKGELFRALPPSGVAVLSRDEPRFDLLKALAPGRVVTTSLSPGGADYTLLAADPASGSCTVEDRVEGGAHAFRLGPPGIHNRHNALLAVAVARGFGVSWERIAEGFERFKGPPMRWECLTIAGIQVINDAYNANPLSMRAALLTFAESPVGGRKWLVLGDMLELGKDEVREHVELGAIVAGGAWAGLVTVGALGRHIARGAREAGMAAGAMVSCDSAAEATGLLLERLGPGDHVLLKASRGRRLEEIVAGLRERLAKGEETC